MDSQLLYGESEHRIKELEIQRDLAAQILTAANITDEKVDFITFVRAQLERYI